MRALLRTPGVLPLFLPSLAARLPMGALGLLLVLQVRGLTGSYALGGLAAGVYALALGISNPILARIADRRGQTLMIGLGAIGSSLSIAAVALVPSSAPVGLIIALAALCGLSQPPVGACMRALWPALVDTADGRHIAYSLESVALEFVYILGPVGIVAGVGSWSIAGALLVCAAAQLTGMLVFAANPVSRAWRPAPTSGPPDRFGAVRGPGVRVLIAVFALCGLAVGAVEVVVPATLEAMGDRNLTGLLLGVWGVGSILGGLAFARFGAPKDSPRLLALFVGLWGAAHAAIGLGTAPVTVGLALLLAGGSIAPTFVLSNGMLDALAPAGTLTEAFTWTSTGLTVGIAAGSSLAGLITELASPGLAMGLLGGGGLLAALVVRSAAEGPLGPARSPASA